MIPSENPLSDQLKKAKESGIEIPVDDLEILQKLKEKRAAIFADMERNANEIIGDEQREKEMKDRSYLEEVKTIFSLRDEK